MALLTSEIIKVGRLTETQLSILQCLAQRLKNSEINQKLFEGKKPHDELVKEIGGIYTVLELGHVHEHLRKDRAVLLYNAYRTHPAPDRSNTRTAAKTRVNAVAREPVEKFLAQHLDPLLERGNIGLMAERLRKSPARLRGVARCIATDLNIAKNIEVSDGVAASYVSQLYAALDLPSSLGNKARRVIVKKVYLKMMAQPEVSVTAPAFDAETDGIQSADSQADPVEQPQQRLKSNGHDAQADPLPAVEAGAVVPAAQPQELHQEVASIPIVQEERHVRPEESADASTSLLPSGPGVPVTLIDRTSIEGICVISGLEPANALTPQIVELREREYYPEVVVLYTTPHASKSIVQVVCVKRTVKLAE